MKFADNINRICAQKGTNLTTLVKEVKGSASFTTAINRGSLPKESEMLQMAQILECSVMDFFADEDEFSDSVLPQPLSDDELDIIRFYRILSLKEQHIFMARMYDYETKMKKE